MLEQEKELRKALGPAVPWPVIGIALLLAAAIVGATGHTGAVLSFGADWLAPPF